MHQNQDISIGLSNAAQAFASTDSFMASLSAAADPGSSTASSSNRMLFSSTSSNPSAINGNGMLISPVQDTSNSITPPPSSTPTSNIPQQQSTSTATGASSSFLTVQLGAHRSRSRAGTLPSRFTTASTSSTNNNSNVTLIRGPSPLLSPSNTIQEPFEDIFTSPTQQTSQQQQQQQQRSGRLRSGSLFGIDSNIWENGSSPDLFASTAKPVSNATASSASVGLSVNSTTISESEGEHTTDKGPVVLKQASIPSIKTVENIVSTHQQAQQHPIPIITTNDATSSVVGSAPSDNNNLKVAFEGSRVRSYTTTNVLLEKQYHLPYNEASILLPQPQSVSSSSQNTNMYVSPQQESHKQSSPQPVPSQSQQQQQQKPYIINQDSTHSNLSVNLSRPRSQTYTASAINLPDLSIAVAPPLPTNISVSNANNNGINNGNFHKLESIRRHEQQQQVKLFDQINLSQLEFVSTFQMATLSPTNCILIINLPPLSFGVSNSMTIFKLCSKFGRVKGVYTFFSEDENMNALVEFESIEMSMHAKAQLNQNELYPGYMAIIGFAKILKNMYLEDAENSQNSNNGSSSANSTSSANTNGITSTGSINASSSSNSIIIPATVDQLANGNNLNNTSISPGVTPVTNNGRSSYAVPDFTQVQKVVLDTFQKFSSQQNDNINVLDYSYAACLVIQATRYQGYDTDFGPLPPVNNDKLFDNPTLREVRKNLDAFSNNNNHNATHYSMFDIESLSLAMLDELSELSSDYLGNTIVQRLFEINDETIKNIMLSKVAPFISQMGIHKNGTWAGQKMINLANTGIQKKIIKDSLYPYVAPLFKDAFGNYLIQGCLKFESPFSDFIFEALCSKFWLVAEDRYGSRAIRAVLESGNCNDVQVFLLASLIVVYAEHLIVHNNGSLLITWFLDTFKFCDKYKMLTVKILPFLNDLVANKLGSLTILKILSNRNDFESGMLILREIYEFHDGDSENIQSVKSPRLLYKILKEFNYGPTFIHKTLSTSIVLERNLKHLLVEQIKRTLIDMKVSPHQQNYRRLMEEAGLGHNMNSNNISNMMNHNNNSVPMYANDNMYVNGYTNGASPYIIPQGQAPQQAMYAGQFPPPPPPQQQQHHAMFPNGGMNIPGYAISGGPLPPQGYPMNFANNMYSNEQSGQPQYMPYANMANQFGNMRIN